MTTRLYSIAPICGIVVLFVLTQNFVGITIDHIAERIYWVDARRDYVGSSDLHGHRFSKIISDSELVSHPFAITVFKDNMYWDDWKQNAIFSADKDHGIGIKILLKQLPGLMDLKVCRKHHKFSAFLTHVYCFLLQSSLTSVHLL